MACGANFISILLATWNAIDRALLARTNAISVISLITGDVDFVTPDKESYAANLAATITVYV